LKNKIKIAYFISHPIQYFSPLFREMAKEWDLTVYYFSNVSVRGGIDKGFGTTVAWDIPILDGYQYRFLDNFSLDKSMDNRFLDAVNPGVFKALFKSKADVIMVNGWTYCSTLMVILFAKLLGKRVWLRADNPYNQEMRKSKRSLFLKRFLLGKIFFPCFIDRYMYTGKESKKFFIYYGIKAFKLVYTPHAVDNDYFGNFKAAKTNPEILKQQLSLPLSKKVILFTGKFIFKKRPMDLLAAYKQLNNPAYCLVMVGDGELREEMERYIRTQQLENVILPGFINQKLILAYYKIADVFVMCSGLGETWGLSVNEAMNFAKPVVISDTCGCQADLVENGLNGYVYPERDVDAMARGLEKILGNESLCEQMGKASAEIILRFSIPTIIKNLKITLEND